MKVVTIIGARPQFIKAAPVSVALMKGGIKEIIIHTGQHYDYEMSEIFFKELGIPTPEYNLGIGGGNHGSMTAQMLQGIEELLIKENPDWIVIYGDTNSTLAGALAASKLHIPVAHIEAGLRSYNKRMPEEINRIMADHVSTLLLCPNEASKKLLANEGITKGVKVVGDVMGDANRSACKIIEQDNDRYIESNWQGFIEKDFALLTMHRAENTDDVERFSKLIEELNKFDMPIVFPMHPRTRAAIERDGLDLGKHIITIKPVGYLQMMTLLSRAALCLTDSGGLQKEAFWAKVPCVTLRTETEWTETVDSGWNQILGDVVESFSKCIASAKIQKEHTNYYGEDVADKIVKALKTYTLD